MNSTYFIKLKNVAAQNALPNGPYNTMLGQSGIRISLFCEEFNKNSINFYKGIPLYVKLLKYNYFNEIKLYFIFIAMLKIMKKNYILIN